MKMPSRDAELLKCYQKSAEIGLRLGQGRCISALIPRLDSASMASTDPSIAHPITLRHDPVQRSFLWTARPSERTKIARLMIVPRVQLGSATRYGASPKPVPPGDHYPSSDGLGMMALIKGYETSDTQSNCRPNVFRISPHELGGSN